MPSGVVIVNASLRILECNANFARLIGPEVEQLYTHSNGLEDAYLPRVIPFSNLFARVMETGEDLIEHDIRFKDTILHGSIFTIEPNVLVGGVLQDITVPSVQKEQIIKKSRQVIQQNLETVQKIAYLLGENAAESEVLLNSIIKSLAPAAPIDVREE